jgi:hypothetical protein
MGLQYEKGGASPPLALRFESVALALASAGGAAGSILRAAAQGFPWQARGRIVRQVLLGRARLAG